MRGTSPPRRIRCGARCLALLFGLVLVATPAAASDPGGDEFKGALVGSGFAPVANPLELPEATPHSGGREAREVGVAQEYWHGLRGVAAADRLYAGAWALHFRRMHDGLSVHPLLGLSRSGFYAATFVNSHGNRSWAGGISRTVAALDRRDAGISLGYRVGGVAGYDERLTDLAGRWPVIPAAEVTLSLRFRRFGIQLGSAGVIASVGTFIELRSR